MAFSDTIIELGLGLGKLQFGMVVDEVETLLGKPSDIEEIEDDEDEIGGTTWHFDHLSLSLSFEEGEDGELTLTSISATDPRYTIQDRNLIGMPIEDFQEIRSELDLGKMEYDNTTGDDGEKQVSLEFEESGLVLWFDDDVLSEIQWGPIWEDDDDDLWVRDVDADVDDRILDYDETYGEEID